MTRVLYKIDPAGLESKLGAGDEEAVVEEVRRRVQRIGGIPREIFRSDIQFNSYYSNVFNDNPMRFYYNLIDLYYHNVPHVLTLYCAPYSRPLVEIPQRGLTYSKSAPSLFKEIGEET